MQVRKLEIHGWRQFRSIRLEFHPQVTIITGANGSGKTTLLKILSQHYGWNAALLSTPKISPKTGSIQYLTGFVKQLLGATQDQPRNTIGHLQYGTGTLSDINIPFEAQALYNIEIKNQQPIIGLHINSHRPLQSYKRVASIPTTSIGAQEAYASYFSEVMQKYTGQYSEHSPIYRMKEAIISMATFGPGNQNVQGIPALAKLYFDFKQVLSKVLPPSIGFTDIAIRIPDVVFITKTGEFVIDAASGGLMAIIELAWQIFLFSQDKDDFLVTIDEPENHLHPSMQRSILSRLVSAFPNAQFIVATHSPFVVSSVRNSHVYALTYIEDRLQGGYEFVGRRVSSLMLDLDAKASSASDILRNVLGVPVTLPEWAEVDLSSIAEEFSGQEITESMLSNLRSRLNRSGLSEYFPDALKIIASQ